VEDEVMIMTMLLEASQRTEFASDNTATPVHA